MNAVLDTIKTSLAAAMPARHVQRSLVSPNTESDARLTAGVICVVSSGGGNFANYRGREGQLGTLDAFLVGYLRVAENTEPVEIERAELALLQELLDWIHATAVPGLDVMTPGDFLLSKQLEHPYGWVTLSLTVKP